eukprot:s103_g19.t1
MAASLLGRLENARRSLSTSAPEAALSEAKEVAQVARENNDLQLLAEAVSLQSLAHLALQRVLEAQELLQQSLSAARSAGHDGAQLILLAASSSAALAADDRARARMMADEGLSMLKRLGTSFERSNRKVQLQLLIAKGNAQLSDQNLEGAAAAACEALTLSRQGQDEEGEGEALHLICLLHIFFGRSAAQQAVKQNFPGTAPLSTLESSNEAAQLFRRLDNEEGEAMALLSIASCRLASSAASEASGAAQRARQIFQALRHRRGRLRSLELLQQAMTETMRALEATEEEVKLFAAEGDVAGQVDALRLLADFYINARIYGEARSALRKALKLLAESGAIEKEVETLLLLSHVEELLGSATAALKLAQQALTLSKRTAESAVSADARRTVSRLCVQSGQAPEAPNRRAAMEALRDLTEAVRKRDATSFQSTMKVLENLSGYEESDVKAALIVEDDADQSGLTRFLKQQGQLVSTTSGSTLMTALSHALLYLSFRLGGLGYGPRFRRCYAYGVQGKDEDEMHAVAYLRHLSSQEEWQKNMEIQPPMLDSMQHSLNAVTMT